jgi:lipopolysaccharide export system ATP-binding protein
LAENKPQDRVSLKTEITDVPVIRVGQGDPAQQHVIKGLQAVPLGPPPDTPFGEPVPSGAHGQQFQNITNYMPVPSGVLQRVMAEIPAEVPAEPPKAVLVAKGLIKRFGKREVVRGVNLEVGAGEIVGLLGRNGAGKTTTFRMIMGLLHADGGAVKYEDKDITHLPMYLRANRGIGYLAQQPSVFQRLTVEDNLKAVLELKESSRPKREEAMEQLIASMGLTTVRKSMAAVLSGGERRRLEIARAMSLNPKIVLFDEPFAGIDPITVGEIQQILKDLKSRGVGVLLTDHNVRETLIITDRTYIMDEGCIWIHGHPRAIVENAEARARYLGQDFRLDF